MNVVLLLGAGTGLGLAAVIASLRSDPPRLATALRALDRPSGAGADHPLAAHALTWATTGRVSQADLALAGRTAQQQAVRKLGAATALGAVPLLAAVLAAGAGIDVRPGMAIVPAMALTVVGFVWPDIEVRGEARERRERFVHVLSSYLDVTAVLLAGGAGTETALHTAAALGSSWPQRQLRAALERCRLTGQTPWEVLAQLGDRLEVEELSQLATSLQLAGEQGARVRLTLTERARALRARQLAAVEARARAVTEQMSVPVALLAVGFMLFVGFPAVWVVIGEL